MDEPTNTNMNAGGNNSSSIGPIIGAVVILAILILGGFYFWSQRENDGITTDTENVAAIQSINSQSSSDDTTSIEADLKSTNVDNLDAELNAS